MCGEKNGICRAKVPHLGSPPRMRGKAVGVAVAPVVTGITPAYAGKRASQLCAGLAPRDHPRVCGEKAYSLVMSGSLWGSPPRMRGKAGGGRERHPAEGITPAYAGKRINGRVNQQDERDHPRVCGEKGSSTFWSRNHSGSPPRMRGKVLVHLCGKLFPGITPACAGKRPLSLVWMTCETGSPPRVRGKAMQGQAPAGRAGITPAYAGKSCSSSVSSSQRMSWTIRSRI